QRIGTRATVCIGRAVAGTGHLVMSQLCVGSIYGHLALALVILSEGMGLTMAPSTASIMSSLPLEKAGVGSAMNDTTRELGGALGVAVLGSIVSARYTGQLAPALAGLPAAAKAAARSSLGGALSVAQRIGGSGPRMATAARHSFTDAMSFTLVIGGLV